MNATAPVRLAAGAGGVALAVAVALATRWLHPRAPLPVLGHAPSFHLVDERGASYTSQSMLGHVSVVDFIFTRCTSSCPRLTARMAELQDKLRGVAGEVQLVSFSVDPDNDTPAVLAAYGAKSHADPSRWRFVTGSADDVQKAVVLGFKMSAAKISTGANDYDVVHGDWLVLVDGAGAIRGYYPVREPREFEALLRDVSRLASDKR